MDCCPGIELDCGWHPLRFVPASCSGFGLASVVQGHLAVFVALFEPQPLARLFELPDCVPPLERAEVARLVSALVVCHLLSHAQQQRCSTVRDCSQPVLGSDWVDLEVELRTHHLIRSSLVLPALPHSRQLRLPPSLLQTQVPPQVPSAWLGDSLQQTHSETAKLL